MSHPREHVSDDVTLSSNEVWTNVKAVKRSSKTLDCKILRKLYIPFKRSFYKIQPNCFTARFSRRNVSSFSFIPQYNSFARVNPKTNLHSAVTKKQREDKKEKENSKHSLRVCSVALPNYIFLSRENKVANKAFVIYKRTSTRDKLFLSREQEEKIKCLCTSFRGRNVLSWIFRFGWPCLKFPLPFTA